LHRGLDNLPVQLARMSLAVRPMKGAAAPRSSRPTHRYAARITVINDTMLLSLIHRVGAFDSVTDADESVGSSAVRSLGVVALGAG